jgi:hypothetical protein
MVFGHVALYPIAVRAPCRIRPASQSMSASKIRMGTTRRAGYYGRMTDTMKVPALRYVAMPEAIANEARDTRQDRFGHALRVVEEAAPCRVCLRISKEPEPLILLSYQPLDDTGPYAEVGPVFVHAESCEPYAEEARFPSDFCDRPLILRSYGHNGRIVDAVVAEPGGAAGHAEAMLSDPAVAEVHVRHESYTCFDFKILRAS